MPRSPLPSRRRPFRFETLEQRQLLAAEILYEGFKVLEFTASGVLNGQTRADIVVANDYHDDYSANLSFSGTVQYSSPTQGSGTGLGSGNGNGVENCPPNFGQQDTYAFSYESEILIGQSGNLLQIDQTTTQFGYSDSTCTGDYSAGDTPFDRLIAGPLDVSTMPYTAALSFSETGSSPYPYRSSGAVNLTVTPQSTEAFNLSIDSLEVYNTTAYFSFYSDGPTTTAASAAAPITTAQLYFSSSPTPDGIFGDALGELPVYWNSSGGAMRVTDIPFAPQGATHLVAVVNQTGQVDETVSTDNFLAFPVANPDNFVTHTFTIQVTSLFDNDGELASVAVDDLYSGSFVYDPESGVFGQLELHLPEVSTVPSEFFSFYADELNSQLSLLFAAYRDGAAHEWLDADFYLSGPVTEGVLPLCLDGYEGTFLLSTEDELGTSMGFVLEANVVSLTCQPTLPGIEAEIDGFENQPLPIDLIALHADGLVDLDPATIEIRQAPDFGSLEVNTTTGVVTYSPQTGFAGVDSFVYVARDIHGEKLAESTITIAIAEVATPYQNPLNPYWVNLEDQVTDVLDVMLIINELNSIGPRTLPPPTGPITAYIDVTGDNYLAPDDAVILRNFINAFGVGGSGEGEGEATPLEVTGAGELADSALVSSEPVAATIAFPPTSSHNDNQTSDTLLAEVTQESIFANVSRATDDHWIYWQASELTRLAFAERSAGQNTSDDVADELQDEEQNADWWLI